MRPWTLVLTGGVIAGALDILYAIVFWAIKRAAQPQRILQSISAGLLGEASFTGGWATAILGLAFHFFIAVSMATAYYLVARRWAALWQRAVPLGAAYGLLLYGIMNHIVVPLSAARPGSTDPLWIGLSIVVHMLFVGIPCAVFARRAILADLRTPVPAVS